MDQSFTSVAPRSELTRGYVLFLLTLAAAAASYVRSTLSPLQESIRIALALTDNQMALLQGPALTIPVILGAIPVGLLIDRRSRVRLLVALVILNVVGNVTTALAPNFGLLFLARCLVGLSGAASVTTIFSLVADLYAPAQRGRASMIIAIGQNAGLSAAFSLGALLLAQLSAGPNQWRWAMLWLTGPIAIVAIAMLAVREPPRTGKSIENPSIRDSLVELWRYRAVIAPLVAGLVIVEIALGAYFPWAAPALSRTFHITEERAAGLMGAGLMISGILGPICGGLIADHCQRAAGPRRSMFILCLLALLSLPASLFAVMPTIVLASAMLVAFMTVLSTMVVMMTTLFTVVIPNELRGLCMSMAGGACVIFGSGLAPLTVSVLSAALGGAAMLGTALVTVCAAMCTLCVAVCAVGSRIYPART